MTYQRDRLGRIVRKEETLGGTKVVMRTGDAEVRRQEDSCHQRVRRMMLAYYVGAYGPTIRLDVQELEELLAVRQLFGRLAAGEVVQDDLCKALVCRTDAIQSLIVRSAPEPPAKALELKGHSRHGPMFSWTNASGDWLECAEKVDALISSGSPGHQYLTIEGLDDAFVELCYRERAERGPDLS